MPEPYCDTVCKCDLLFLVNLHCSCFWWSGSLANVFQYATCRRRCLRLEQGRGEMTPDNLWSGKKGPAGWWIRGGDVDPYHWICIFIIYIYVCIVSIYIYRYKLLQLFLFNGKCLCFCCFVMMFKCNWWEIMLNDLTIQRILPHFIAIMTLPMIHGNLGFDRHDRHWGFSHPTGKVKEWWGNCIGAPTLQEAEILPILLKHICARV